MPLIIIIIGTILANVERERMKATRFELKDRGLTLVAVFVDGTQQGIGLVGSSRLAALQELKPTQP